MAENLSFITVNDPHNDLFLPWLDLFETAFPPNEKILVSTILKILWNKVENEGNHLAAILDENQKFIGMAMYQLPPDKPVGVLWYVAVVPGQRSKGWGSVIYKKILTQLDPQIYKGLVFEVEIPGEADSSPDAERRILFYQKNGAKLLKGIHYLQSVGWHQPRTHMHIMIHPLQPLDAETAFDLAYTVFDEAMQKTGPLSLE